MGNIHSIKDIIALSGKHGEGLVEKISETLKYKGKTFYKNLKDEREINAERSILFVENFSTYIIEAGYYWVDNYDVFGVIQGKAILKKGTLPYGGKFVEPSNTEVGKDVDYQRKYEELSEKYIALLEKVNSGKNAELLEVVSEAIQAEVEHLVQDFDGRLTKAADKIVSDLKPGM